jgi:hypothetical protein
MQSRAVCVFALVALSIACAGRPQPEVGEPAPPPLALDPPAPPFPAVDSTTLAALTARLERVAQDSSLLAALSPSNPRVAALIRELEASHDRLAAALSTPDATGRSLHDRLTAQLDSLRRVLEERNRQAPRP